MRRWSLPASRIPTASSGCSSWSPRTSATTRPTRIWPTRAGRLRPHRDPLVGRAQREGEKTAAGDADGAHDDDRPGSGAGDGGLQGNHLGKLVLRRRPPDPHLTGTAMHIRTATSADPGAIAAIYNPHVADTCVSFETAPVEPADMAGRIDAVLGAGLPWLVAEEDEAIIGYAYATPWKPRQAYRNSVESTIYLARDRTGRGIGNALYAALLDQLRDLGLHTAIG